MGTTPEAGSLSALALAREKQAWLEWICLHRGSRPDGRPHPVVAAFVDPVPPLRSAQPSRWLCVALLRGEPLLLRRPWKAPRNQSEFEVITYSNRSLGTIGGAVADLIEVAVSEGILPQVSAIVADPDLPPEVRIQLSAELVVWVSPGDRLVFPRAYDERGHGDADVVAADVLVFPRAYDERGHGDADVVAADVLVFPRAYDERGGEE